jgi:hypothetical protein
MRERKTRPGNSELPGVQNPTGEFWYRLPGESWQAYRAFACYRDLGRGRTQKKVARYLYDGKNIRHIEHWSTKHQWLNRVEAFDANEEFERMIMLRERRYQWIVEDLEATEIMQAAIRKRLMDFNPNELTPNQLIRWYDVISRRQEKILGITPEQMEEQLSSQANSDSELERLLDESEEVRDAYLDYIQRRDPQPDIG